MKDPKDKHKLIVDPEAAVVVREIFDMAIAKRRIIDMARTLNERGVKVLQTQAFRYKEVY